MLMHKWKPVFMIALFDGLLMLRVNLPVVDIIHTQSQGFVMGVKIKATGESKLNNLQPCDYCQLSFSTCVHVRYSIHIVQD